jgi:precorrin-6y C5,15-methyltransferase (decarboxylating) CbiE subunit
MNLPLIAIVGCGPGAPEYLTDAARAAVAGAEVVLGSSRLLAMFPDHPGAKQSAGCRTEAVLEEIAVARASGRRVAVLVSGDPGVFSLARNVLARFGRENCHVVPGISSVQVALARLGLDGSDIRELSAHGRTPDITAEELVDCGNVAVLAGGREGIAWSAYAAAVLDKSHAAFLCENLTLPGERIARLSPAELAASSAASLSLVLLIKRECLERAGGPA